MNRSAYEKRGMKKLKGFFMVLALLILLLATAYGAYKIFFIPAPVIDGIEGFKLLSSETTIILRGKNLKSINVFINQDNKNIELLKDMPESTEKSYTIHIKPKDLNLRDGSATVIIKARSGILKDVKHKIASIIDTVPPMIEVIKAPRTIHQGSGGFALLRAKEADSVFIKLENNVFRAFKAPSKEDAGHYSDDSPEISGKKTATLYYVFFPAPFESNPENIFYAYAKDNAGNQNVIPLSTRIKAVKYKSSTIEVDDFFIKTVVFPLLNGKKASDPEDAFKKVNEEWRKVNTEELVEIASETEPDILWEGRFLQSRNTKVMATYGDMRTYYYNGKPISQSAHLGYDLASTKNAVIGASNAGVVRFAGNLGIYGNTVIIDHGLGLMSLYGHLSMIMVEKGQEVRKNEDIAKTGASGLAGGDHLHFGILIHGHEVSPLYWWDPHWIKVNVFDYLEQ